MISINVDYILEKLKSSPLDLFEMIGLYNVMVFSKELFKKNANVAEFIARTAGITLPVYITKSRTMMAAKTSKTIISFDEEEQKKLQSLCVEYFRELPKQLLEELPRELKQEPKQEPKQGPKQEPKEEDKNNKRSKKKREIENNKKYKKKNENEKLAIWLKGLKDDR